jgi:hypothetical protein
MVRGISLLGDSLGYTNEFKNGAFQPARFSLFKSGKTYNVKELAPTSTWLQAARFHPNSAAMNGPGQIYIFAYDCATNQENLLFLTPQ